MTHSRLPMLLPGALLAVVAFTCPAANAQSDNDLRRENQRLTTRVSDLEQELAAALARIAELEAVIEQLRRPAGGTPAPPPPSQVVTIDESHFSASPRALLRHLQENYGKVLAAHEIGSPRSRERMNYLREVTRWASGAGREFVAPMTWRVKLLQARRSGRDYVLQVEAIDPVSEVSLGAPTTIFVEGSKARPLEEAAAGEEEITLFELEGTLLPRVEVNREREAIGVFDNPPFIGPFAEFGYSVNVVSLLPIIDGKVHGKTEDTKSDDADTPRPTRRGRTER